MSNAAELRKAAEANATVIVFKHAATRMDDEPFENHELPGQVAMMAKYVLNTVHNDDDYWCTGDWIASVLPEHIYSMCADHHLVMHSANSNCMLSIMIPIPHTRRQFRELCRGVNIELRDGTTTKTQE